MSQDSIYGGMIVDIAEESMIRAQKLLTGIKNGGRIAVGNALARSASSAKSLASKEVSKEYSISQSQFRDRTYTINHFSKDSGSGVAVTFGYRGHVIPLIEFDTSFGKNGLIQTRVKRNSAKETLNKAFTGRVGGHTGVFEREYDGQRLPIKELYGPSTPQMMYSNEDVLDSIEAKTVEVYENRIEHEITRLLNGWG